MQYFKRLSLMVLGMTCTVFAPSVLALGTTADDTVSNNVTLSYSVNSVAQSTTASVDFEVDRKYVLNVSTTDTNWVTAVPGQTFAGGNYSSIQFSVTNSSNDEVGVRLALIDQGATQISDGDPWDPVGSALAAAQITVWEDSNGNGSYDAGTDDLLGNTLGILPVLSDPTFAADEVRDYYVSIDVNAADAADLFETYTLVAAVADATGTNVVQTDDSGNSTHGVADPAVNPNDKDAVENVFAEFASANAEDLGYDFVGDAVSIIDEDFDGQASNSSGFRTRIALGVAKHVETLWDPVTGNKYDGAGAATGNEPKAIPGAVLLYVIGVSADSGVNATAVLIDDDIPDTLVLPGNPNAVAGIELPNTVDITISGTPTTFTLDAGVTANDEYHTQDCAANALVSAAFDAGPEIDDADLGDCDAGETGYVAYVVTVNDT